AHGEIARKTDGERRKNEMKGNGEGGLEAGQQDCVEVLQHRVTTSRERFAMTPASCQAMAIAKTLEVAEVYATVYLFAYPDVPYDKAGGTLERRWRQSKTCLTSREIGRASGRERV